MKRYIIFFSIPVIFLDQFTKYIISKSLLLYETLEIIPGLLDLTHIRNRGGAFGMFGGVDSPLLNLFFLVLSIIAILILILFIKESKGRSAIYSLSFSLILGGAFGNLLDRIRIGEVIDFIDLHLGPYHWPAFNLADSAITFGVFLLIFDLIRRGE